MKRLASTLLIGALCFALGRYERPAPKREPARRATCPQAAPQAPRPGTAALPQAASQTQAPRESAPPPSPRLEANRLAQEAMNHLSDDDPSRAVDLFGRALQADARNQLTLENYSNFLVMRQDCDSAKPLLQRCTKNYPKSELCWGNLTTCSMRDLASLDQLTSECLASDPRNMMCLNNRGQLMLRRRDYAGALKLFEEMRDLNSRAAISFNDGVIDESLALSYEGTDDLAAARDYYTLGCKEGMPLSCKKLAER